MNGRLYGVKTRANFLQFPQLRNNFVTALIPSYNVTEHDRLLLAESDLH